MVTMQIMTSYPNLQLWLSPLEDQPIDTELRFTGGMAQFPMARFILKKMGD